MTSSTVALCTAPVWPSITAKVCGKNTTPNEVHNEIENYGDITSSTNQFLKSTPNKQKLEYKTMATSLRVQNKI